MNISKTSSPLDRGKGSWDRAFPPSSLLDRCLEEKTFAGRERGKYETKTDTPEKFVVFVVEICRANLFCARVLPLGIQTDLLQRSA